MCGNLCWNGARQPPPIKSHTCEESKGRPHLGSLLEWIGPKVGTFGWPLKIVFAIRVKWE